MRDSTGNFRPLSEQIARSQDGHANDLHTKIVGPLNSENGTTPPGNHECRVQLSPILLRAIGSPMSAALSEPARRVGGPPPPSTWLTRPDALRNVSPTRPKAHGPDCSRFASPSLEHDCQHGVSEQLACPSPKSSSCFPPPIPVPSSNNRSTLESRGAMNNNQTRTHQRGQYPSSVSPQPLRSQHPCARTRSSLSPRRTWGEGSSPKRVVGAERQSRDVSPLVCTLSLGNGSPQRPGPVCNLSTWKSTNEVPNTSVAVLASEYLTVCSRYEGHLKELKNMCDSMTQYAETAQDRKAVAALRSAVATVEVATEETVAVAKQVSPDVFHGPCDSKTNTPEWGCRVSFPSKAVTLEWRQRPNACDVPKTPERTHYRASLGAVGEVSNVARRSKAKARTSTIGLSISPLKACLIRHNRVAVSSEPPKDRDESMIQSLLVKGVLTTESRPWEGEAESPRDDLGQVAALFACQVPGVNVLGVYRIENAALSAVYHTVRKTLTNNEEHNMWHGTSLECVQNIALNGFNRGYCGRHGLRLGHGTYFSVNANYSMRFCDRRSSPRVMFFAKVLAGLWTKGSSDLIEPPHRDNGCLSRFDSTVDDIENPSIFCVFRDYQALPSYLVKFEGPS